MNPFTSIVGSNVWIQWKREEDDWPTFHVVSTCKDQVILKGINDLDGSVHTGDTFSVDYKQIRFLRVLD